VSQPAEASGPAVVPQSPQAPVRDGAAPYLTLRDLKVISRTRPPSQTPAGTNPFFREALRKRGELSVLAPASSGNRPFAASNVEDRESPAASAELPTATANSEVHEPVVTAEVKLDVQATRAVTTDAEEAAILNGTHPASADVGDVGVADAPQAAVDPDVEDMVSADVAHVVLDTGAEFAANAHVQHAANADVEPQHSPPAPLIDLEFAVPTSKSLKMREAAGEPEPQLYTGIEPEDLPPSPADQELIEKKKREAALLLMNAQRRRRRARGGY
jgi:hypothetical protein